jgi:hypothetical protein
MDAGGCKGACLPVCLAACLGSFSGPARPRGSSTVDGGSKGGKSE